MLYRVKPEVFPHLRNHNLVNSFFVNDVPILQPSVKILIFYRYNKFSGDDLINIKMRELCCLHLIPIITLLPKKCKPVVLKDL